jgi:hypothetical protein
MSRSIVICVALVLLLIIPQMFTQAQAEQEDGYALIISVDVCKDGVAVKYSLESVPARGLELRFSTDEAGTNVFGSLTEPAALYVEDTKFFPADLSGYSTIYIWYQVLGAWPSPLTGPLVVLDCLLTSTPTTPVADPPCDNLFDGRINRNQALDCAAPVAIYHDSETGRLDIFGIHPDDGDGIHLISLTQAQINAIGVPNDAPVLLGSAVNPNSGATVSLYRLPTGEYQLSTTYPDGKDYIIVWDGNGNAYHIAA